MIKNNIPDKILSAPLHFVRSSYIFPTYSPFQSFIAECEKAAESSDPPAFFNCPKCGRPYKSIISLEVHLNTFNHDNPPEDYDPTDMEWKPKKRKERLKEIEEKEQRDSENDSGPAGGNSTPLRNSKPPGTPVSEKRKTPGRKKYGSATFGSHRKRKVISLYSKKHFLIAFKKQTLHGSYSQA